MPELRIEFVTALPRARLLALYTEAGWWSPDEDPARLDVIVRGAFRFLAAFWGEELIGMARAISDGCSDAYIQDVFVTMGHRGQGVARALMEQLIAELERCGISWIGLIAQPGTEPLYQKLNFNRMTDHVPMLLQKGRT
jgi:aralkylamine N-acetyltransferase